MANVPDRVRAARVQSDATRRKSTVQAVDKFFSGKIITGVLLAVLLLLVALGLGGADYVATVFIYEFGR